MRIVAGLLAVVMLAGCSGKDKVPSGVLPRAKMENILWDMVTADQYSAVYLVKDSARINIKTEDLRLYQQVFRLHGISRDEFRKSLRYYEDRPDLLRNLLDTVIARGTRLRAESYSKPLPAIGPVKLTPSPGAAPPAAVPARTPGFPLKVPGQSAGPLPVHPQLRHPTNKKDSSSNKDSSSRQKRRLDAP
jgi:hypothetical protein